eukprot:1544549-Pyramimonas_sp.AAC.1
METLEMTERSSMTSRTSWSFKAPRSPPSHTVPDRRWRNFERNGANASKRWVRLTTVVGVRLGRSGSTSSSLNPRQATS